MFKIVVEKECGCFRRSELENNIELASKDDALMKALDMVNEMNSEYCAKHKFSLEELGNSFIIKMN